MLGKGQENENSKLGKEEGGGVKAYDVKVLLTTTSSSCTVDESNALKLFRRYTTVDDKH